MVVISGKEYRQLDEAIVPKGFPCGSAGKEFTCNMGDLGSIPVLGRSPEEEKGHPLQHSGLENSIDCIVHFFVLAHSIFCQIVIIFYMN